MAGKTGVKILSRFRAHGVVVSKAHLLKQVQEDPSDSIVSNRKLRIAGLPNRKGAHLRKR